MCLVDVSAGVRLKGGGIKQPIIRVIEPETPAHKSVVQIVISAFYSQSNFPLVRNGGWIKLST